MTFLGKFFGSKSEVVAAPSVSRADAVPLTNQILEYGHYKALVEMLSNDIVRADQPQVQMRHDKDPISLATYKDHYLPIERNRMRRYDSIFIYGASEQNIDNFLQELKIFKAFAQCSHTAWHYLPETKRSTTPMPVTCFYVTPGSRIQDDLLLFGSVRAAVAHELKEMTPVTTEQSLAAIKEDIGTLDTATKEAAISVCRELLADDSVTPQTAAEFKGALNAYLKRAEATHAYFGNTAFLRPASAQTLPASVWGDPNP